MGFHEARLRGPRRIRESRKGKKEESLAGWKGAGGAGLPSLQDRLEERGVCLSRPQGGQSQSPFRWGFPGGEGDRTHVVEIKIGKLWAKLNPRMGGGSLRKGWDSLREGEEESLIRRKKVPSHYGRGRGFLIGRDLATLPDHSFSVTLNPPFPLKWSTVPPSLPGLPVPGNPGRGWG